MTVFVPCEPPLEVVLVHPEIPPNTGNVARLCACTGARLHLVAPIGFPLSDRDLRRGGLDYWDRAALRTWGTWDEWAQAFEAQGAGRTRMHLFTAAAPRSHVEADFRPGDRLVFGCESRGLPAAVLETFGDRTVALPMLPGRRSLNLSSSVAAALYEALRRCGAFGPPRG